MQLQIKKENVRTNRQHTKYITAFILTIGAFLLPLLALHGQQLPVLTFGFESPQLFNPAISAQQKHVNVALQYRQQWVGMPGAPETFLLSADGSPAENMGVGFTAYNDETNIIGRLGVSGNYAYNIKIAAEHSLSLGLSAILMRNQIYYDRIKANKPEEALLLNYAQKATAFDAGFGLRYSYKSLFYVDMSAINLLKSRLTYQDQASFKENQYQLMTHYFLALGYNHAIQDGKYKIEPWLSLRSAQGVSFQYETNLSLEWNETVKLTGGYRQDEGFLAAIQVRVFGSVTLGFAHDFSRGRLKSVSNGTNEIYLSYRFSKEKNSFKERTTSKEIKTIKRLTQEQSQEIERLQQENERLVRQQALNDSLVKDQKVELDRLKEIFKKDKEAVDKIKEKHFIKETEVDSIVSVSSSNESAVKSIYVIVGAYLTLADAKLFQKILEREVGLQTLIFEREDGRYYFVYTRQVKSGDEARREFKRLKRLKIDPYINGNVWLYGERSR